MITLSVDDNPTIITSLTALLERIDPAGRHDGTTSGIEALDMAREQAYDVFFLDVEMPEMTGLEVAEQLKSIQPHANIVFATGHSDYAMQAFGLFASGYLLKPITENQLRAALSNLRYHEYADEHAQERRVKVQCFGFFEVWCDHQPIAFKRKKTKMLLAYLVDRNGAMCSTEQMVCALWPDAPFDNSYGNQLRVFISDLQTTLTKLGVGHVLVRERGGLGINKDAIDCDYYAYLDGNEQAERLFHGEYMSQYEFGEATLGNLMQGFYE